MWHRSKNLNQDDSVPGVSTMVSRVLLTESGRLEEEQVFCSVTFEMA